MDGGAWKAAVHGVAKAGVWANAHPLVDGAGASKTLETLELVPAHGCVWGGS